MKEVKINVNGMMCGGCENRVKNAVGAIDGVASVEADHNTGIVTVNMEDTVETAVVEEAIEDIGFEVVKE